MQEALFLYFFKLLFVDFSFPCFVRVFSCVCVCVRAFSARSQQECKSTIFFSSFFSPPVLWPAASELMLWVSVQFDWKGNRVWEVVLLTVWCLNNPLLCPEWDNGGVCKSSHLLSFFYICLCLNFLASFLFKGSHSALKFKPQCPSLMRVL